MAKASRDLLDFEGWAADIRASHAKALATEKAISSGKSKERLRPAQTSSGVLSMRCYHYYRRLKQQKRLLALAEHLEKDGSGRWLRHKRQGTANVLRLLEEPGAGEILTPSRRARMTIELDFADRYDINPKLLLGFLYEAGAHQAIVNASRASKPATWIQHYQLASKLLRKDAKRQKQSGGDNGAGPPKASTALSS